MLRHILASTALATVLAGSAYAQTDPAVDPAQDPAAPVIESPDATATDGAAPMADDADSMATDGDAPMADDADTLATDGAAPMADDADTMATEEVEPVDNGMDTASGDADWTPIPVAEVSAERLIGTDIMTGDDEMVASIEDIVISDDGAVEGIVAQFGGFLGFGSEQVMLTPDEIEIMQDSNENLMVRTSLTPESIEDRPAYEE